MLDYQQRVVMEKVDLAQKIVKLTHFITSSDVFADLHDTDQCLLREQHLAMLAYDAVLGRRIKRFKES